MKVSFYSDLVANFEAQLQQLFPMGRLELQLPLTIQPLPMTLAEQHEIRVSVLRADLIHATISGNKWFKLKYNLLAAQQQGFERVVSFGGAWSNHLHALAQVCHKLQLQSRGLVRGEELNANSNPMLRDARDWGMQLHFLPRQSYRSQCRDPTLQENCFVIPEGSDNWLGVVGASTLLDYIPSTDVFSHVITALGTGCTFAGLRLGLPACAQLWGVSALKGQWPVRQMQQRLLRYFPFSDRAKNWHIYTEFHRGGFGRIDAGLIEFCNQFERDFGFALDYLYTGKAMMALMQLIENGAFEPCSHVLFIHSGGVQGNR